MGKPICIPDVSYFSGKRFSRSKRNPTRQVRTRRQFRNLLKYLTYRDGSLRREALRAGSLYREIEGLKDGVPAPAPPGERWTDCGLGKTYREIMNHAVELGDETVLARTWIVSPDPALLAHIPEEDRPDLVSRMTEEIFETFHEQQGWSPAEYSYVIHTRETEEGLPHVHAHVISAGTYFDHLDGARVGASHQLYGERRYFIGKRQLIALRDLSDKAFHRELTEVLGTEKVQELIAAREIEDDHAEPFTPDEPTLAVDDPLVEM